MKKIITAILYGDNWMTQLYKRYEQETRYEEPEWVIGSQFLRIMNRLFIVFILYSIRWFWRHID